MKLGFLSAAVLTMGLSFSGVASAALMTSVSEAGSVTVSQSIEIIETGQSFEFSLSADDSTVFDGVFFESVDFFINLNGDFTGSDETFTLDDSIVLSTDGILFNDTAFNEVSFESGVILERRDGFVAAEFDIAAPLTDFVLALVVSDLGLSFLGQNSADVDNFFIQGFNGTDLDFVEVGVTFNVAEVPEPTTLAVFALGLMGLAVRRFKKTHSKIYS